MPSRLIDSPPIEILIVCTGNVCRSPMAEALLRDRLAQRSVEAEISSAGTAFAAQPPTDEVIELMKARGLDVSKHRSRLLKPTMVTNADLVVGMAREHVREAVLLDPNTFPRTFTLRELVRLAEGVGQRPAEQSFADWLAVLGEGRTPAAHLSLSVEDDIEDPMGRRFSVYKKSASEIEQLVDQLVRLAFPVESERGERNGLFDFPS